MGGEHEEVRAEDDDGGGEIEDEEEDEEGGGEPGFGFTPEVAGEAPGEGGGEREDEGIGEAEGEPSVGAPEQVDEGGERRLVIPDSEVERFAAEDLQGGGGGVGFFGPEDAQVAEPREEEQKEEGSCRPPAEAHGHRNRIITARGRDFP